MAGRIEQGHLLGDVWVGGMALAMDRAQMIAMDMEPIAQVQG